MSVENVEKFYTKLGEDKALREKVTKAGEELKDRFKTKEDFEGKALAETYLVLEPFAREAGWPFTLAELETYQKETGQKLTDAELDAVAGGGVCACVLGGAGIDKVHCTCPLMGVGGSEEIEGKRSFCFCLIAGGGH